MRPTDWPRQHAHVSEFEILAVKTESLSSPRQLENLDSLKRAAESLRARHAEALEFLGTVAQTNPKSQAAARDYIDEGRVLGQLQRMEKRRQQDVGADGDAGGARRDRSRRGHQRRQIPVVSEMMLCEPDGIEADLLGGLNLRERLAIEIGKRPPRSGRIPEVELIANFDLAHDSPHGDPMAFVFSSSHAWYLFVRSVPAIRDGTTTITMPWSRPSCAGIRRGDLTICAPGATTLARLKLTVALSRDATSTEFGKVT